MLEDISLYVPAIALILAILRIPSLALARETAVLVALGCGSIYLAVPILAFYLVLENDFLPKYRGSWAGLLWIALLLCGILILTALSPTTLRTFSELAQLALYVLIFFLFTSLLKSGCEVMRFLRACVWASVVICLLAYATVVLGWQAPPHIYVGRGSNEGSIFVALLGVIPACALFARSKNPLYIFAIILFGLTIILATSRSSLAVAAIAIFTAVFCLTRLRILQIAMACSGALLIMGSTPVLVTIIDDQINFSARERIALIEFGWSLMQERFWTGWGWGSTFSLAASAPTTQLAYPHFHNTYVQLFVELGALGWIIVALALRFLLFNSFTALMAYKGNAGASVLVVAASLGIILSGISDAMLFGADRTIQLVFLFGLIARTSEIWRDQKLRPPSVRGKRGVRQLSVGEGSSRRKAAVSNVA